MILYNNKNAYKKIMRLIKFYDFDKLKSSTIKKFSSHVIIALK